MEGKKPEQKDEPKKLNPTYILSSNDHPGLLITHVQLKETNFDEWARAIQNALKAKKKLGFIDGTLVLPTEGSSNSAESEEWGSVNATVIAWILNTVEGTLRSTITPPGTARKLWLELCERFTENNGARIQQIKASLMDLRQCGMTVMVYYSRLKKLWDELVDYEQFPTCSCKGCTCGGCRCDLASLFDKRREEEKLHQFLAGLDESTFGTVRSNILSWEPLPSVAKAYAKVCQEERVKNNTRNRDGQGEVMAMSVQSSGRRSGGENKEQRQNLYCTYCTGSGHEMDTCFQVVGYPDWWGNSPRNNGGRGRTAAAGRGRGGSATGRGRGGPAAATSRVNSVQTTGVAAGSAALVESDYTRPTGFTKEQFSSFVNFLNSCNETGIDKLNGKEIAD